ncbi:serine/threonine protein kinase [Noviherbaspirillum sp.]|uniref:serine/threonine protein kinase n=1 Tax=Noviherbaspirillum sp. TaxID=1926288 RepID=UPI002FE09F8C
MTFPTAASLVPDSPAVNRIGRFYITRELGRGSVGCVYLGHDPVIARDIAIKTFKPRLSAADRNKHEQHFINEARAAGRLSHPNIVTVYDASSEGGSTYIAMEYLQGHELNKILANGHRFLPDEVATIGWKIADALDHAHRNQVIHRDIKPANIFMVRDDQPKLVDFGIARSPNRLPDQDAGADEPYTLFRNNNLLGTPNYMSPEQASGKQVDERTDIYSLGAVMYEMLTGRKPFEAGDTANLLQQIAYKAPPPPSELDPRIPVALSQIVMMAMSKKPEKRYPSAEKMALDIKRFLMRERRARRSLQIPVATLEQKDPAADTPEQGKLAWVIATLLLAVAAGFMAIAFMRDTIGWF